MRKIILTFLIEDKDFKEEFGSNENTCKETLEDWVLKIGGYTAKVEIKREEL